MQQQQLRKEGRKEWARVEEERGERGAGSANFAPVECGKEAAAAARQTDIQSVRVCETDKWRWPLHVLVKFVWPTLRRFIFLGGGEHSPPSLLCIIS